VTTTSGRLAFVLGERRGRCRPVTPSHVERRRRVKKFFGLRFNQRRPPHAGRRHPSIASIRLICREIGHDAVIGEGGRTTAPDESRPVVHFTEEWGNGIERLAHRSKSEIFAQALQDAELSRKQVAAVFESLSGVIKKSLRVRACSPCGSPENEGRVEAATKEREASTPSPKRK